MLTEEEDVEIHALVKRGWSISEIARHVGRDRKTIRAYLAGDRQPGVRRRVEEDPFDGVEAYVAQGLSDEPSASVGTRSYTARSQLRRPVREPASRPSSPPGPGPWGCQAAGTGPACPAWVYAPAATAEADMSWPAIRWRVRRGTPAHRRATRGGWVFT